jgi:dCMP deaminase
MINKKKLNNYFKQAYVVSENSPDLETKVGSILVKEKTGAVIASSYNGFIRKGPDNKLPKIRPEKYKYIIHSEINLFLNCARHGISTEGCFLVVTLSPCINCARAAYQAGITTIYFKDEYKDFQNQLNMEDLNIQVEKIDEFTKLTLSPK